jgi:hypothetical protein
MVILRRQLDLARPPPRAALLLGKGSIVAVGFIPYRLTDSGVTYQDRRTGSEGNDSTAFLSSLR